MEKSDLLSNQSFVTAVCSVRSDTGHGISKTKINSFLFYSQFRCVSFLFLLSEIEYRDLLHIICNISQVPQSKGYNRLSYYLLNVKF